jgi:hypothetical protein
MMIRLGISPALISLLAIDIARADFLSSSTSERIGKVEKLDSKFVYFDSGCKGKLQKISWSKIKFLVFNEKCSMPLFESTGGDELCSDKDGNPVESIPHDPAWVIFKDTENMSQGIFTTKFDKFEDGKLNFKDVAGNSISMSTKGYLIFKLDEYCNPAL